MATNLKEYVRLYDDAFDAPFCNNVIEQFHKSESTYLDRDNRPTFHELNISQRFMAKDPLWDLPQRSISSIFQGVVSKYVTTMDVGPDFPERWGYEEFRLKMYENNDYDQFKEHVDVGDHASARRFLVCFLYLNDVEEGGETVFPKLKLAIKPKCGRILLFPATWQYRHAGLPPISGKKYIVGSYLHYL
tara:strand:+ start:830 stop:1396 length:567 start_codon:yes stop_codon:yes gene_type:complete